VLYFRANAARAWAAVSTSEVNLSPILVRPVREQLEHDRVIRLLQAKYKRKFEVAINPGHQQVAPVGSGPTPWYPDLVLHSAERGRKLAGVVEVETAESVNNLEAMSQWVAFSKQRADFHLYVPASTVDVARRLAADHGVKMTELWAYHSVGDQVRFVLVQRAPGAPTPKAPSRAVSPPKLKASPTKAPTPGRTVSSPKADVKRPVTPSPKAGASKTAVPTAHTAKAGVRATATAAARPAPNAAAKAKGGARPAPSKPANKTAKRK
jgi:hypothetical protein